MTFRYKNLLLLLCFIISSTVYTQNNYFFDSSSVILKSLNINTDDEAEFGPFKIGKLLYFTSSKERKVGAVNLEASTLHQMLDLYSGVFIDSVRVRNVKPLSDKINNSLNQGSCFFDRESSKLYYSTDVCLITIDLVKKCKLAIYSSEFKNNAFEAPKPELVLPDTFSAAHPMVHNNKLYFSSNLTDSKGKTDIYSAENIEGQWKNI